MKLTPEQEKIVEQARREGRSRVHLDLTPDQQSEVRRGIEEEEAGRDENIEAFHRREAAEAEPGFFGDLRRAVSASGRSPIAIAEEIGTPLDTFEDFLEGQGVLAPEAIARLVSALGLRLMAEIPG